MSQAELFADNESQKPRWRADPDKVRARLERILNEARAADTIPWSNAQTSLYRTILPNMTRWLPDEEAIRWRADFEAELERLAAACS